MKNFDALIIGKGPAGIQAAIYLKRANMNTIVIGKDLGATEKSVAVENYFGIPSLTGKELLAIGAKQLEHFSVPVLTDEVLSLTYEEDGLIVKTITAEYRAKTVLIATGSKRSIPRVRNILKYEGKGVSYCAVCDGFFFKDKKVAVIGAGEYAANEAKELSAFVSELTILTNGDELTGEFPPHATIISERIKSAEGDEKLRSLTFRDGTVLDFDGVFIAVGSAGSAELAQKIGVETQASKIIVDEYMATNVPGVYAAGDCTFGPQQIAKAVGDGCIAGMAMIDYIRQTLK